ncbi:MAG: hypothetical protein HY611_08230, partial [Elusimicrobia bacterium]|nr:hypothetical protein [Elusimicrobiota bacterium]
MTIQAALASVLVLAAFSAGHPVMGQQNEDCMACHSDGLMGAPRVDFKSHKASIHGRHLCISCHADAANLPHPEKLAPVSCKTCHRIESQIYMSSDHGQAVARGLSEAAACKDCHGRTHTLLNSRNPQSPVNRKNVPATCGRCHKDLKRMEKFKLSELQPVESYAHTVHGEAFAQGKINAAVCSDCHGSHDLHGAANSSSRIFWRNIPETCGRCHNNVLSVYQISIHGQATRAGIKEAPGCTSCHGEHTIRSPKDPFSSSWTGAITKTCAGCHASETLTRKFGLPVDRLKTYMDTYHGLAYQRGDLMVANCASCHGFHDVLAHTDPRSSIYRSNLSNTCGKCHPGAGAQLAHGYVHGPPAANQHWSLRAATWFYLILIPLVLGGMMLHNGLDFVKKLLRSGPPHHDHPQDEMRLSLNERLQHGVLLLVFFWLAYTGFALKYPETLWDYPLHFAAEDLRRSFHRWAALLF